MHVACVVHAFRLHLVCILLAYCLHCVVVFGACMLNAFASVEIAFACVLLVMRHFSEQTLTRAL